MKQTATDFCVCVSPPLSLTFHDHTEGDEGVQGLEDDSRFHHAVVIEFSQILYTAHTPLVVLGVVYLRIIDMLCNTKAKKSHYLVLKSTRICSNNVHSI